MDDLLRMFGGGQREQPPQEDQQAAGREPGGVWEFEMPVGGIPPPSSQQGQGGEAPFVIPGGVPQEALDIQESTIEGYYKHLGLEFERMDQGLWLAKYKGSAKDYDMYVELTPQFLVLVIPVIERVRDVCREKLWYHLLRLNYLSNQVRFGLNKRDEVLISIEIPARYLSFDEFKNAFSYIGNLVDDSYPELIYLSQKADALSSFMKPPEPPPGLSPMAGPLQ
ncbi:MAG: hypothetical protein RDV48_09710 [Candidatus Eremiobacteraeota bacterium]|nr:hypothetical protein [Candidatus Eremiobacteraeota bacterium]